MDIQLLYNHLLERLSACWSALPDKPEESPIPTLMVLWQLAAGHPVSTSQALELPLPVLKQEEVARLNVLVEQRISGVPLAYLTGRQTFMGIQFQTTPQAMIPRKETEILGRVVVDTVHELAGKNEDVRLLDLCTGSGNLALSAAYYEPKSQVVGSDLSYEAVELARRNALALGLAGRAVFLQGDLFSAVNCEEYFHSFELISCNPPYISTAHVLQLPNEISDHEPHLAFDGGPYGISLITRLVREAPAFLATGGYLCFEVGLGQGTPVQNMVKKMAVYKRVETFVDEQNNIRALRLRCQ